MIPLLLHIDTATDIATVTISEGEKVIGSVTNENQKEHASFLQAAIKNLLHQNDLTASHIDAISVTAGPGSYTGLRVGIASAKGLCYALDIPLIFLNTLEVIAASSIASNIITDNNILFCAMIDARRQEVFTAVYDKDLNEILPPCAMEINAQSFKDFLAKNVIHFSGSGAKKASAIIVNDQAKFENLNILPAEIARMANLKFQNKTFIDVHFSDALYIKEFYIF